MQACGIPAVPRQDNLVFWHQLNTCKDYFQLGHVACRVTSKGLGIGPCERQWGDVKQMCTGKRSAISSERLEKQAILFGDHSIRTARLKRNTCGNDCIWGPDDLAHDTFFTELDDSDSDSEESMDVDPRDSTRAHFEKNRRTEVSLPALKNGKKNECATKATRMNTHCRKNIAICGALIQKTMKLVWCVVSLCAGSLIVVPQTARSHTKDMP